MKKTLLKKIKDEILNLKIHLGHIYKEISWKNKVLQYCPIKDIEADTHSPSKCPWLIPKIVILQSTPKPDRVDLHYLN